MPAMDDEQRDGIKRQLAQVKAAELENQRVEREIAALGELTSLLAELMSLLPPRTSPRTPEERADLERDLSDGLMRGGPEAGAALIQMLELIESERKEDLSLEAIGILARLRVLAAAMLSPQP